MRRNLRWLIAVRGAIGLMRLAVVLEQRPCETQMISVLETGVIYIAWPKHLTLYLVHEIVTPHRFPGHRCDYPCTSYRHNRGLANNDGASSHCLGSCIWHNVARAHLARLHRLAVHG